jgi:hypothetical protein
LFKVSTPSFEVEEIPNLHDRSRMSCEWKFAKAVEVDEMITGHVDRLDAADELP